MKGWGLVLAVLSNKNYLCGCLIFFEREYNGDMNNTPIPYDDIILTPAEISEIDQIAASSQRFSTEEVEYLIRMNKAISHAA